MSERLTIWFIMDMLPIKGSVKKSVLSLMELALCSYNERLMFFFQNVRGKVITFKSF